MDIFSYLLGKKSGGGQPQPTKAKPDYVNFTNCPYSTLDLSWLDTSKIENMTSIFEGSKVTDYSFLTDFDTKSVKTFKYAFRSLSLSSNIELDLSNFNLSSCTDVSFMFRGSQRILSISCRDWDVKNVTTFESMCDNATRLKNIDISNWDMQSCTNFSQMFSNCYDLTNNSLQSILKAMKTIPTTLSNKNLSTIGLYYHKSKIINMPEWQELLALGWTE